MRHRQIEPVPAAKLANAISRTPMDHFILWSGVEATIQEGSLSSRALRCVQETGAPLSLRELLQRAARLEGDRGLDPDLVRSAIRIHQNARPSTHFLVRLTPAREYVAVTRIPWPAGLGRPIEAGEQVANAFGCLAWPPLSRTACVSGGRRAHPGPPPGSVART